MTKEECVALLYRYAEYDGVGIPNLAGCREAMKMAADMLSQPSLPSNLDEAAIIYINTPRIKSDKDKVFNEISRNHEYLAFKAGAEWMAGQFEKNRLAACNAQTKEEYEMETAFVDKIIREQHRTPTFSDAINFGIEWQKKQK